MPISLLAKFIAGLFTAWLVLIWTDNIPNPSWLKENTESLLAIPAAVLWFISFWEEISNYFRNKFQTQPTTPVVVNVHNMLPTPPPEPPVVTPVSDPLPTFVSRFDTGNRQITGPDDPILDPWLGKPLHGRDKEIDELTELLGHTKTDVQVTHAVVLAEGGVGKTEEPLGLGYTHSELAKLEHAAGNIDLAQRHWQDATRCAEKVQNPHLHKTVRDIDAELGLG